MLPLAKPDRCLVILRTIRHAGGDKVDTPLHLSEPLTCLKLAY